MKKNISYIVLAAIIIGIIVVVQPWKLGRTPHNEGTDTTAVQLENCLPAEGNESIRIVPVKFVSTWKILAAWMAMLISTRSLRTL